MIRLMLTAVALAVCGAAFAKLPPPDDAAKAKAAETAAKAAWQAKRDSYLLCKAQDRVVAQYRKGAGSRPPVAVPADSVTQTAAAATAAAPAAATAAAQAAKTTPSSSGKPTTTAEGGGTPVKSVTGAGAPPALAAAPCSDPGPFAYAPPDQKPLETSGAHSPAPTASSPPSVKQNSAEMAPTKPSTASPAKKP
jgi:hypothetical protein